MKMHINLADKEVRILVRTREIAFAGNRKLKIYGVLSCESGKRMKRENRVFFKSEEDARDAGYRPCGHCMREAYKAYISKKQVDERL